MIKDKKITKIGIITLSLILLIGVTYAFFEYYMVSDNREIIAGDVWLNMDETDGFVTLTNIFPETKEKARARDDNTVTFTISGANTTTDNDIYYEILLNYGETIDGKTRFDDNDLVFDLVEIGTGGTETYLLDAVSFDNLNKRIWVETISKNTTSYTKTYRLRVWLNENVIISDSEDYADYPATNYNQRYASIKVGVYGSFKETYADAIGTINYDGSQYGLNILPTPIYESGNIVVTSEVTSDNVPRFLGYSTTPDGEVVYQPGDVINRSDLVNNSLNLYMIKSEWDFYNEIETKFASILTTADSDGTSFIKGNVTNNYVWYSGKLWRVVALNSNGTIKLVTQNSMTLVAWDILSSNNSYSTSQIRSWLNNEFLETINQDLIVESIWDDTTYSTLTTTKNTITNPLTEKVGLLTIYDYAKTGGNTSSSTSKTFLNNGYYWWTMSPKTSTTDVWYVNSSAANSTSSITTYGVRPSVNLKSNIKLVDNGSDGSKEKPYILKEDYEVGKVNDNLNTRITGEYIKFNNVLYRLVEKETVNDILLTIVTMADYSLNKNTLGLTSFYYINFSTSLGIGRYLEDWYKADSTSTTYASTYINDTYKAMIATNADGVKWYIGPDSGGTGCDYTLSKTGTPVEATIGLGRYGEMFSSQFGDGSSQSTHTWLITKRSSDYIWYMYGSNYAIAGNISSNGGVRPSFYLKSDVKIVSGSGTQYDPYEITQ